jgi:hypothetical protein
VEVSLMRRCTTILAFTLALLAADLLTTQAVQAQDVADLQQQLESGLKARRPVEFAFIRRVVVLVQNEQLPVDLVKGIFNWARKKARFKKHPYQYFERAMREEAKKLGVQL